MSPHGLETTDLTLPTGFSARGTNSNADTDENRSLSRDENLVRGRKITPFSRSMKLERFVTGLAPNCARYGDCDRHPRIRSLLSLPVPSETVYANANYLGAHTSFDTDANAGTDCDTDTRSNGNSNTDTNGSTGEHSIPATAGFESNSGSFEDLRMKRVLQVRRFRFLELRGRLENVENGSGSHPLFRLRKIYEGTFLFGGASSADSRKRSTILMNVDLPTTVIYI